MNPQVNPGEMTEDDVLSYTRNKRMELANKLTATGVPTDKEQAGLLLQTLDGLDRSSLTRLRIKTEEKANTNSAHAAALIAEVLSKIGSSKVYQMDGCIREVAPQLPSTIPDPEIVQGELETHPQQIDYDGFMKQFENPENQNQKN